MESISIFDDLVDEYLEGHHEQGLPPADVRAVRDGLIEKLSHEGKLGWRQDG